MNLNSQTHDMELRQAVEQQLDLILKMEQQRKALKKQNRFLHQKLKQSSLMMSKYQRQTKQMSSQTSDFYNENNKPTERETTSAPSNQIKLSSSSLIQYGIQVQIQLLNNSNLLNCSKLNQAQSLLKVLESYEHRTELSEKIQENKKNFKKQKLNQSQKAHKNTVHEHSHQTDKAIASEMLKLTKQLNATKKQLKQIEHKYKLRDKQISQLRKCLQTKSQALQKSRKQFNELSNLMNTEKFKSVRTLQSQVHTLKSKLVSQQEAVRIKEILAEVAKQYQSYKKQAQNKIQILIAELAAKERHVTILQGEITILTNRENC